MAGAHLAQGFPLNLIILPFFHEFTNHAYQSGIGSNGWYAKHIHPQCLADLLCLGIKVEENFHVVGHKTNGNNHQVNQISLGMLLPNHVANIGLQPRLLWRTAATLVNQLPRWMSCPLSHQTARLV